MGLFLPSETARLVLGYLIEKDLPETSKQLMVECPSLTELSSLKPQHLKHATKINGRSLGDILTEYQDLISAITALATEISGDEESLRFELPLKTVAKLGERLKHLPSSSSSAALSSATTQTLSSATSSKEVQTTSPVRAVIPESLRPAPTASSTPKATSKAGPPRTSPKQTSFFHPNIRLAAPPKPGYVAILPRPLLPPSTPTERADITGVTTPGIPTGPPSSSSTPVESSSGISKKSRKGRVIRKARQSDDEFLNQLLSCSEQIVEVCKIPENVGSQSISEIVDRGLDNEQLFNNLINVMEEMGEEEDEVNTPPTSPLSLAFDTSDTVVILDDDQKLPQAKTTSPALDKLASIVNSTIMEVTKDVVEVMEEEEELPEAKKRKRKGFPGKGRGVKKAKGRLAESGVSSTGSLGAFAQKFRSVLPRSVRTPEGAGTSTPLVQRLAERARAASLAGVKEEVEVEEVFCEPDSRQDLVSEATSQEMSLEQQEPAGPVELFAQGKKDRRKGPRCRKCPACKRQDCGLCRTCRDKTKFGGAGCLKQACLLRQCSQEVATILVPVVPATPQAGLDKENSSQQPGSPAHVRTLLFSPPTPDKSILKTLTPQKNSSPIKRTCSAWNKDVKDMMTNSIQSAIPFTEEVVRNMKQPITVSKRLSIPITLPPMDTSRLVAIPASAIPASAIVTSLPPGYKSLGFTAVLPAPATATTLPATGCALPATASTIPATASTIPAAATTHPATATTHPATATTLPATGNILPAIATSLLSTGTTHHAPATSMAPPTSASPTSGQPTLTPRSSAPPALSSSTTTAPPALPPMVQLPKSSLAAVLKNTSSTPAASLPSTSRPLSWDEKLRASLGAAEMDMSHISHRIQARDKGRRRSPRKRRPLDKPESEEEEDESEDEEEDAPELELSPDNITPEAQKILDTFANQLLEKLEENVAKNVVQVGSCESSQSHSKGKKKGEGEKDCICCKLEAVLPARKVTPQGPAGRSTLNKTMPVLETSPVKKTCLAVPGSLAKNVGAKIRAKSRAGTSQAGGKKSTEVEADKTAQVKESEVIYVEDVEEAEVDQAAEVVEVREDSSEVLKPVDVELGEATLEVVDKVTEDKKLEIRIDSLIESFEAEPELEAAISAPPVTPKKSDTFVFKTPHKTPSRARHIPPSPLQHLLSSPRALPLTPGRPSYQPSLTTPQKSGEEGGRSRHPSTLDTPPVLASPLKPPTTPNAAKSSPAYYTPSPAHSQGSQGSPVATPGLRFLQEEGQRLSENSDSQDSQCSPSRGQDRRKSFRNLFKKSAESSKSEQLGALLESRIGSLQFRAGAPLEGALAPGLPLGGALAPLGCALAPPLGGVLASAPSPFMSPNDMAGRTDYTSSPQIALGRPSPLSETYLALEGACEDPSLPSLPPFVSPNRTCYLSPTAMQSSSLLGFQQSARHDLSTDEEQELLKELPKVKPRGRKVKEKGKKGATKGKDKKGPGSGKVQEVERKEGVVTEKQALMVEDGSVKEKEAKVRKKGAGGIEKEAEVSEKEAGVSETEAKVVEKEAGESEKEAGAGEKETGVGEKEATVDEEVAISEKERRMLLLEQKGEEETNEAIAAYVTSRLSDEDTNTSSLPPPASLPPPLPLSLDRPELSEDSDSSSDSDKDDDMKDSTDSDDEEEEMEEKEKEEELQLVLELESEEESDSSVKHKSRAIKKVGSFVESFLEVESREPKPAVDMSAVTFVKTVEEKNQEAAPAPPQKPARRIALVSMKRKSPIKDGSTSFEANNDANNLDTFTQGESVKVLKQDNLGAEASFDLGLEEAPPSSLKRRRSLPGTSTIASPFSTTTPPTSTTVPTNQLEPRKSPRKAKTDSKLVAAPSPSPRRARTASVPVPAPSPSSSSTAAAVPPQAKKLRVDLDLLDEGQEVALQFSPSKVGGMEEAAVSETKLPENITGALDKSVDKKVEIEDADHDASWILERVEADVSVTPENIEEKVKDALKDRSRDRGSARKKPVDEPKETKKPVDKSKVTMKPVDKPKETLSMVIRKSRAASSEMGLEKPSKKEDQKSKSSRDMSREFSRATKEGDGVKKTSAIQFPGAGLKMARIPKLPKDDKVSSKSKPGSTTEEPVARLSSRTSPKKTAPKAGDITPKKKVEVKPVNLLRKSQKEAPEVTSNKDMNKPEVQNTKELKTEPVRKSSRRTPKKLAPPNPAPPAQINAHIFENALNLDFDKLADIIKTAHKSPAEAKAKVKPPISKPIESSLVGCKEVVKVHRTKEKDSPQVAEQKEKNVPKVPEQKEKDVPKVLEQKAKEVVKVAEANHKMQQCKGKEVVEVQQKKGKELAKESPIPVLYPSISKSVFMVFHNKLPFGTFEDDLLEES